MSKPPISTSQGKPDAETENAGAEGAPEGGKSPLKKPLGLSLRKPSLDGGGGSVGDGGGIGGAKPAPSPKTPIEEAIELALASASTAVDSAQEIQRLRGEVQTIVQGSRRANMILFYATILVIVFASVGLFSALVFYKRSYNEFDAVAKVNRDALLAFAGEINGLIQTSSKIEESLKISEQALSTTGAQTEEIKKAIQGFTAAHNALTAKIPPANAYDKPIAGLKQAIDDLTASNKGINARLIDMQQAQVARDQAPPPVVEKPKVEAAKPQPKRTPAVASGRDALIRYP
jgi:hypothetical protein